jgi:hypothetical protein
MKRLICIAAILNAANAVPAAGDETVVADETVIAIEIAISQGLYAVQCPGAHYNQALADETVFVLEELRRFDKGKESFALALEGMKQVHDDLLKKGGTALLCADIRDSVARLPNPFLKFDPKRD